MKRKIYVGIDNGATGTITILSNKVFHFPTPTKVELSFTKAKQYISRIEQETLIEKLSIENIGRSFCLMERPMLNPMRWKSSISAARALEATLIILEQLKIPYAYIDSKEWQKYFFPHMNLKKKTPELKTAAITIARRLFPSIKTKDADSILIAEYARRMNY